MLLGKNHSCRNFAIVQLTGKILFYLKIVMSVTKPMTYCTTAMQTLSVKTQWEVSGASVKLVTERHKDRKGVPNVKVRQT